MCLVTGMVIPGAGTITMSFSFDAPARPSEVLISSRQSSLKYYVGELSEYRQILYFLVWKNLKVQYAETVLGFGWLVLRPLLSVLILTTVFGKLAKIPTGDQPYALFVFSGMLVWNYFSGVSSSAANSMTGNAGLLTKIYFPRVFLPASEAISGLVEFSVTLCLFFVFSYIGYGLLPGWHTLFLPLPVGLLMISCLGLSLWLSTLAVDFRDVRYATTFLMQALMFAAPIVWPVSLLAERFGDNVVGFYALYPVVGTVEGMRYVLLGGEAPWAIMATSGLSASVLLISGIIFFQRRERLMADKV